MKKNSIRHLLLQTSILIGISCLIGLLLLNRTQSSMETEMFAEKTIPAVTLEQLKTMISEESVLCIDARDISEFNAGHIHGAISIPTSDIDQALAEKGEMIFTQNKPIIVYCSDTVCSRSLLLARKLAMLGIDQVSVFTDGWEAWKAASLPSEP